MYQNHIVVKSLYRKNKCDKIFCIQLALFWPYMYSTLLFILPEKVYHYVPFYCRMIVWNTSVVLYPVKISMYVKYQWFMRNTSCTLWYYIAVISNCRLWIKHGVQLYIFEYVLHGIPSTSLSMGKWSTITSMISKFVFDWIDKNSSFISSVFSKHWCLTHISNAHCTIDAELIKLRQMAQC